MISSQTKANFVPLSPVSFLLRNAQFFTDIPAVIYGDQQYTYGEFYRRVQKLAAALQHADIAAGNRVAILAPNIPPMLEIHYAVPVDQRCTQSVKYTAGCGVNRVFVCCMPTPGY